MFSIINISQNESQQVETFKKDAKREGSDQSQCKREKERINFYTNS
jgi:hypothetical protein